MSKKNRKNLHKESNKIWIIITLIFTFSYMLWRMFFTMPVNKGISSIIFWALLLIVELFGLVEMVVHFYNMYDYGGYHVQKKKMKRQEFPHVDVFIPSLDEPGELLEKTIAACKAMEYPDNRKIHIYLCDDGEREEMAALAKRMKVNYLARTEHSDAKAGNLNFALAHSDSPYIVIFDADMIPRSQFLMETIPYFTDKVGFVQTPQNYYRPDVFQYNLYCETQIPNEQDYFYKVVQISKNKSNSVVFGGSNAVLSRKALEHIGGIVTGVVTEDFATGIELQKEGYRGIALDTVLASGIPPATFSALIKQRRRWARGCIQSGGKTKFLKSKTLTFIQKINYFTAISYWYAPLKRLIYFFAPVLFAMFGVVVVECSLFQVLLFWLPMYLCSNICMKRFSQNIRTGKWTNVYEMCFFPYLLFPVLKESLGRRQKEFHVTNKHVSDEKSSSLRFMLPFLAGTGISIVSVIKLLEMSVREETFTYGVILFWLLLNLYYMIMAVYVSWGRNFQDTYLFQPIETTAELIYENDLKKTKNKITITGMGDDALQIKKEENFKDGRAEIRVKDLKQSLLLLVNITGCSGEGNEVIAQIQWNQLKEEDKYRYWNFIYDRKAVLPEKLKQKSVFRDEVFTALFYHLTEDM